MTDIIVEIFVAVLSFLALATKEITVKRGRIGKSAQRRSIAIIGSPLISKIYQEADKKQCRRGHATEVGQIDT
jgi:hypothetical protein